MAEIEDDDLISRAALMRPQALAGEFDKLLISIRKVVAEAKKSESALKSTTSTSKMAKETDNLRKSQRALSVEQEKAAKIAKVVWQSQNEVADAMKRAALAAKNEGDVLSELDRQMAKAANDAAQLAGAQQKSTQQSVKAQQAYKAEAGSLQALIQRRIQLQNANKDQKKNQEEDADLLRKGTITRAQYNQRMTESAAVIAKNSVSIQTLNQQIKTHILSTGQLAGAYKQLTTQLDSARTRYKDMAASGTATTKALRNQQKVVADLDNKVKAIDKSVGQFQRNVGNYPGTFGAATQAVTRFLGAFGIVTGLALFARAMKDVINLSADFEYKNSTLQAVLGETREGIRKLTEQQIKYGQASVYSALQVADLQIVFSKMGLTTDQINNATEATLNLATATGEDLAKSADVVGTLLQSFGIDAAETTRIVDVMTAAFNKTTLGIDNFFEAMKYVAPIAKANNISLEETTALLGTLADAGIRGSMAGTSLRKIISDLDKGSGSLSEKLKALADKGFNSADAMDEVGRTAYASLLVLTKNTDQTAKLNTALQDVNGTAAETSAIMADNLTGDMAKAANAAESLSIAIGTSLNGSFRSIVQATAAFLLWLKEIPALLRENRGLIIALGIALIGFNANAIRATLAALGYELALKRMIIQERIAAITTKSLSAALLANPIGAVVIAIGALVAAISLYDKYSERAEKLERQRAESNRLFAETSKSVNKAQQDLNVSTEKWLSMSEDQRRSHAEQIQAMVNLTKARILQLKAQRAQIVQTAQELSVWQSLKVGFISYLDKSGFAMNVAAEQTDNVSAATEDLDKNITDLGNQVDGLTHLMDKNTESLAENKKKQKELSEEEKKRALELKKSQLELDKFRLEQQVKTLEEIKDNENNSADIRLKAAQDLERARADIAKIDRAKALLEEFKNKQLQGKNQAELLLAEEKYQAALTEITKIGNKDRDTINKQDIEKEIKDSRDKTKIMVAQIMGEAQARADAETLAIQRQVLAGLITREKGDKLIEKAQKKAAKELLELSIETYAKELDNERNLYYKEREKLILDSNASAVDKEAALILLKKESAEEQAGILMEIANLEKDLNDLLYNSQSDNLEKLKEDISKVQTIYEQFSTAIAGLFNALTARRLANIDSEEKRADEYYDNQIRLAGDNEKAQARIENEREKRRKQFERQRITEQRRAAKLEKAQAIISATIAGALAVLNALSTVKPYPAAVIAAVSAGILAGAQIATIAAAPLPQYADGTPAGGHPGGLAIVGEQGSESVQTKSGRIFFTPDKPTAMDLEKGAIVTPHDQTVRDLAMGGLMRGVRYDTRPNNDSELMLAEIKGMRKDIRQQSQVRPPSLVNQTGVILEAHQDRDGLITRVRSRAMGKWRKKNDH
jgi:hypothetical protein